MLAIGAVLAYHAGLPGFKSGWLGVDLFFAMSGFLITTLLLNEWSESGKIGLKNFWIRRFLRLMPAYYLYIFFITIAILFWPGSVLQEHGGWRPVEYIMALWFYAINYLPQGGIWNGQPVTIHLWSLAVEEQYYLAWPLFLWLSLRYTRFTQSLSWILFVLVLCYFLFLSNDHERSRILYTRGISLFLASAVAVTLFQNKNTICSKFSLLDPKKTIPSAIFLTFVVFALSTFHAISEDSIRHYFLPILICFYVALVGGLWYFPIAGYSKIVLTQPVLVYIGKISYGVYLYHEIARVFTWWVTQDLFVSIPKYPAYGLRFTIYILLSISLASISYHMYERKFLKLKYRFYK